MQTLVATNTPKVITRVAVTVERLQEIIKTFQVAGGNALPGQEIDLEITPGIVLTYDPQVPTFSAQADRARQPVVVVGSPASDLLRHDDPLAHIPEGQPLVN